MMVQLLPFRTARKDSPSELDEAYTPSTRPSPQKTITTPTSKSVIKTDNPSPLSQIAKKEKGEATDMTLVMSLRKNLDEFEWESNRPAYILQDIGWKIPCVI